MFAIVVLVFLVIGTFMDAVPAIIILQPIIGPMGASVGIDPYHMGIVVVLTLAIGLITPAVRVVPPDRVGSRRHLHRRRHEGDVAVLRDLPNRRRHRGVVPRLMLWIPRTALPGVMP